MTDLVPTIKSLEETAIIGKQISMSLTDDKTGPLWQSFMPLVKTIENRASNDFISLQQYPENYFSHFEPARVFEKWAAVEVSEKSSIHDDLSSLHIPGGLYAVFHYIGSSNDAGMFHYIFSEWLPNSEYTLDQRPHFEVLGAKYRNDDDTSEEHIWIPIKKI